LSLSDAVFLGIDSVNLNQIKYAIRRLSISQLRRLDEWLHELLSRVEEAEHIKAPPIRKDAIAAPTLDNKTYRLESIRCGKEKCKCNRGKLHGPYWYSYTRTTDKVTSQYIGKKLPKDIEKRLRNRTER